ncbi:antiviral reverse transcriptase Drt2 [uncultured Sphingomonas sp.]|uniref:antiviral reverse transcriptase Drt2 n=1 Tax=uncultured Sphingomonas sp. TaxID=158754 RepID=UPI002590A170|nr:antiviral reverse transcriptase Drt2 [uncultured Sphingomonas sp.]
MKAPNWFRPRGYLHLDMPVKPEFATGLTPAKVAAHKWSPLIHYVKSEKRYKVKERNTVAKERPIMFASHRDSCILSKYSAELVTRLDDWYAANGLDDTVIAYRSLGKSNYHFARRVEDFVRAHPSLTVMCFDVTGFFDNLDHKKLKERLKWVLGCDELADDWFAVFRTVTRYHYVHLEEIKKHDDLAKRLRERKRHPLATIAELKALGVPIEKNPKTVGIPQGTPISASLSNLYMTRFDAEMEAEAAKRGALYQRYSDDILVACPPTRHGVLKALVEEKLADHGLELQSAKTEVVTLHAPASTLTFQYLGYQLGLVDARLRLKSLSRQWRTAKRAIRKTERVGLNAIKQGKAKQIFTRKLHKRFTGAGDRNFLAYAERSAATLDSPAIRKQAKKLRRYMHGELARLRGKPKPKP